MINRIYWDLDETLISTLLFLGDEEDKYNFDIGINIEGDTYHIKINPAAWRVLEFSRKLVGNENVWMLTTSVEDYAKKVNKHCQLKFPENQIISREELKKLAHLCRWDAEFKNPYKNKNNVLIDNLIPRQNQEKMMVIGISVDNYLEVDDYYGAYDETFAEKVEDFLNKKHNED